MGDEHESSEEKFKVIFEIVIKIIKENCSTFRNQRGTHSNRIPRHRKVLFKKRKILNKELRKRNPPDRKKRINKTRGEIDKKLLDSYEEESIVDEARAIEYIKSNPKYFFTYARKKLKTKSKIGPFDMGGEKITSLSEICTKLVEQYSSSFSQPDPKHKIENPREFFSMNDVKTKSVPGAALFLISFIASIIDFCVKSISPSTDLAFTSFMEKNSLGFSILCFGSGWEKLDEYCSTNFVHISDKLVIFSPPISKGPILLLVLSFFLAYVKKYLGFDFMYSLARASSTILSSSYESNNFLSISPMVFSIRSFLSGEFLFFNSLFSIFLFLNNTLLCLGILFECETSHEVSAMTKEHV